MKKKNKENTKIKKNVKKKEKQYYTINRNIEMAKGDYFLKDEKRYLTHSEVPFNLRGQGIGKVLVEKTFEQLTAEQKSAVAICAYIKAVKNRDEHWNGIIK